MKAQTVSKAGTKIEKLMEENRGIRSQVKKLTSIFQGRPLLFIIKFVWVFFDHPIKSYYQVTLDRRAGLIFF